MSWLSKSLCDLHDWYELDELYALEKVCALCKMNIVAWMLIPPKWKVDIVWWLKLNREWAKKFL